MRKKSLILIVTLFSTYLIAQDWGLTWKMTENIFQPPQSGSNFNVVRAGFDTDNDGKGEFITAFCEQDSNFVMMYEATGDDTYELVWSWMYPPYSHNSFNGIAVGDVDGNGLDEIFITLAVAVGDANAPRLWVFEWNGVQGENKYGNYATGVCEPHGTWDYGLDDGIDFRPKSLMVEDIDNDGKNELITGNRGAPDIPDDGEIYVSNFTGTFTGFGNWNIEFQTRDGGGALYSIDTGDLDGDGNKEIYGLLWDMFTLRIYEATGPDTYEMQSEIIEAFDPIDYGGWDGVGVADVNNDGINEMYIAGMVNTETDFTLFAIQGEADNSTIDASDVNILMEFEYPFQSGFRNLQICDPDEDGNINLMIAGHRNGLIHDIEYKGNGDPMDSTSWDVSTAFDIFALYAAETGVTVEAAKDSLSPRLYFGSYGSDMDGDGENEYVFVNYSSDFDVWTNDAYVWIIEDGAALAISPGNSSSLTNFTLEQNYPNPFNPQTNITFSLKEDGFINLTIYDVLGKKVRTIVNEYKNAGEHSIVWDGINNNGLLAASGLYIYKLKTNSTQISKSMSLIR
jgi:hypothetical protein